MEIKDNINLAESLENLNKELDSDKQIKYDKKFINDENLKTIFNDLYPTMHSFLSEYINFFNRFNEETESSNVNLQGDQLLITDRFITLPLNTMFEDDMVFRKWIHNVVSFSGDEEYANKLWTNRGKKSKNQGELFSEEFEKILSLRKKLFDMNREVISILGEDKTLFNTYTHRKLKLFYGKAGTGKTTMATYLSKNLYEDNKPCIILCNGTIESDDLVKQFTYKEGQPEFFETEFLKKIRNGGVVILDEINALPPQTLAFLQPLLDDKSEITINGIEGTIKVNPNFQVIATMNLNIEGTISNVNRILLDRCKDVLCFNDLFEDKQKIGNITCDKGEGLIYSAMMKMCNLDFKNKNLKPISNKDTIDKLCKDRFDTYFNHYKQDWELHKKYLSLGLLDNKKQELNKDNLTTNTKKTIKEEIKKEVLVEDKNSDVQEDNKNKTTINDEPFDFIVR